MEFLTYLQLIFSISLHFLSFQNYYDMSCRAGNSALIVLLKALINYAFLWAQFLTQLALGIPSYSLKQDLLHSNIIPCTISLETDLETIAKSIS